MPLAPGDNDPPVADPPDPVQIRDYGQAFESWMQWLSKPQNAERYYMDQATIDKIRGHKFGNRKLATVSALARMNKTLREAGQDLATVIAADQGIVARIAAMNAALATFLGAFGLGAAMGGNQVLEVTEITTGQIPTSVWFGYIDIPIGNQTGEARATCHTAEMAYADQAGQLRSRLALIVKTVGTLNDIGNSAQKPNVGGKVGDPAHQHKG